MQVAEWAGHSVAVLLSTHAKCIDGQEDIALERIQRALDNDGQCSPASWGSPKLTHVLPTDSRKQSDLPGLSHTQNRALTGT